MAGYKTYFNWSSGKDSALALHRLLQDPTYQVDFLLTSINPVLQRVSMHGLRTELLYQQVATIGIPHGTLDLTEDVTHATYEKLMEVELALLRAKGFKYAGFGDIFLEDLRVYREKQLSPFQIQGHFPIWKQDTKQLIHEFIEEGFKAIVICINGELLDKSFAGRVIDKDFIKDLPAGIDPCGENGEFHTFCYDAPYFDQAIAFEVGETVNRSYIHAGKTINYWFTDLLSTT